MKQLLSIALLGAALCAAPATRAQDSFNFGVIGHSFSGNPDEGVLRRALDQSDADNLAFVVVNGIKSAAEPCSDALYSARRDLLNEAENGVIVSLAASDWVGCRNKNGSVAIERLNRVRDLFFPDEFSFGASKVPLFRQSVTPKFRSYTENARWEFGDVLFATVNLPAANNHFLQDGGRNSEFEDRLIANKDWLRRVFTFAAQKNWRASCCSLTVIRWHNPASARSCCAASATVLPKPASASSRWPQRSRERSCWCMARR